MAHTPICVAYSLYVSKAIHNILIGEPINRYAVTVDSMDFPLNLMLRRFLLIGPPINIICIAILTYSYNRRSYSYTTYSYKNPYTCNIQGYIAVQE